MTSGDPDRMARWLSIFAYPRSVNGSVFICETASSTLTSPSFTFSNKAAKVSSFIIFSLSLHLGMA